MRAISKLVLAGVVLGALTTTASAAVNLTPPVPLALNGYTPGTLVWDFDSTTLSNFSFVGSTSSTSNSSAAEPAGDTSTYGYATTVSGVATPATFSVKSGVFNTLSIYLGSIDSYNTISFYGTDGLLKGQYTGDELTNPAGNASGDQGSAITNGRFLFTFDAGTDVNKVVFDSSFPAFEFDNIAATISAVPEPATWAMMILGFGFVGFMLRNGRREGAVATAA